MTDPTDELVTLTTQAAELARQVRDQHRPPKKPTPVLDFMEHVNPETSEAANRLGFQRIAFMPQHLFCDREMLVDPVELREHAVNGWNARYPYMLGRIPHGGWVLMDLEAWHTPVHDGQVTQAFVLDQFGEATKAMRAARPDVKINWFRVTENPKNAPLWAMWSMIQRMGDATMTPFAFGESAKHADEFATCMTRLRAGIANGVPSYAMFSPYYRNGATVVPATAFDDIKKVLDAGAAGIGIYYTRSRVPHATDDWDIAWMRAVAEAVR